MDVEGQQVLLDEDQVLLLVLLLLVSPHSLLVGLVVGSDVVHLALGDDTQVNVAAGPQVVEDAGSDGVAHQQLGLGLLQHNNTTTTTQIKQRNQAAEAPSNRPTGLMLVQCWSNAGPMLLCLTDWAQFQQNHLDQRPDRQKLRTFKLKLKIPKQNSCGGRRGHLA